MPHHAVFKETSNTTKVRIVFDASAKSSNGISLNDLLMVGPTIQDKLLSHLIRFRTYNYVISADVEKMYRQILVNERDRRFQRILWREDNEIKTYQLNTLTFGISSSPFFAIRTIKQLTDDEYQKFPKAAEIIKNYFYVDDLLTGADTVENARAIRNDIIALLGLGGFSIRQWASNDLQIINDLSVEAVHKNLTLDYDTSLKTLGVSWSTYDDEIHYSISLLDLDSTLTKRKILSDIARIFDPIGLMGPLVLHAKKIMQDIWRSGVQWDESVPQSIQYEWTEFIKQLKNMSRVSFDRKISIESCYENQIHGFCDASNVAYGACLYARSVGKNGEITSKLICSKSRVAPIKPVTIPRLELCGALLLARLFSEVAKAIDLEFNKIIFWSDSTIVLHWLKPLRIH
ncbi:uncharacterized protein [Cardiocondyla obscurior]|uniref:uncharacterized protein n=1 Tax=Cardiocondyla obscurior TaxID=286306 RepID=UPI0039658ABB